MLQGRCLVLYVHVFNLVLVSQLRMLKGIADEHCANRMQAADADRD
jgi:hypothetical protein